MILTLTDRMYYQRNYVDCNNILANWYNTEEFSVILHRQTYPFNIICHDGMDIGHGDIFSKIVSLALKDECFGPELRPFY